jgi:hypothetical protein
LGLKSPERAILPTRPIIDSPVPPVFGMTGIVVKEKKI